jgi:hypothetical protein
MRERPDASLVPARRSRRAASRAASRAAGRGASASNRAAGLTGGVWRVAAVALLLAVTVIGLRSRGTFSAVPNLAAAGVTGATLAIALAVCEGVALVAVTVVVLSIRPRRGKLDAEELVRLSFPWWAKTLGVLLALALLAAPIVVLFSTKVRKKAPVPPLTIPLFSRSPKLTTPGAGSAWPVITGMAVAVAVVVTLMLLTRRKRLAGAPRNRANRLAGLAEGLAAGGAALTANREPREAIIACYAAMEHGFAAAGSAPAAADTPAEVLARATDAGIVRPGPAEVLTDLFRRARYSTEPMTAADTHAAAAALTQLRADLEDRGEPAWAATGAAAGTATGVRP